MKGPQSGPGSASVCLESPHIEQRFEVCTDWHPCFSIPLVHHHNDRETDLGRHHPCGKRKMPIHLFGQSDDKQYIFLSVRLPYVRPAWISTSAVSLFLPRIVIILQYPSHYLYYLNPVSTSDLSDPTYDWPQHHSSPGDLDWSCMPLSNT